MKVAITGGTGFLGKYVIDTISNQNYTPIVLSRDASFDNKEYLSDIRTTDYSKADLLEKLSDIDAVMHLAAKRGSQERISEFHDNQILTQNLYETCLQLKIKNIVYASTISVYSGESSLPWIEDLLPNPRL